MQRRLDAHDHRATTPPRSPIRRRARRARRRLSRQRVADPYRWLERSTTPQTRAVDRGARTRSRSRIWKRFRRERTIKKRLTELWNYERYDTAGASAADAISICATTACRTRACCTWRSRSTRQPRVLLDPNTLSKDATIALGEFVPSPDGKLLAYSLSDGGTRLAHLACARRRDRHAICRTCCASSSSRPVAWTADSRSLYYARYPLRAGRRRRRLASSAKSIGTVLGTRRTQTDPLIYKVDDHPTRNPVRAGFRRRPLPGHLAVRRLAADRHLLPQARRRRRALRRGRAPVRHFRCGLSSSSPRSTTCSTCAPRKDAPNAQLIAVAGDVGRAQGSGAWSIPESQHSR